MSHLRGIDRAHDVDLGPSHHQPVHGAMRFVLITEQVTDADRKREAAKAKDRARPQRPPSTRTPRCGAWMPKAATTCARAPGHRSDGHRSRESMDKTLLGYRA